MLEGRIVCSYYRAARRAGLLAAAALSALCALAAAHIVYHSPKRLNIHEEDRTIVVRLLKPLPPAPPAASPPTPRKPETASPPARTLPPPPTPAVTVERVEERPLAETAAAETTIIASETETEAVQPPEPLAIDIDTSAFIGAFRAVIQENLYYPKNAHRAGITGEVKILVVFNADGSVLSYEALDGSYHKSLGKAAFSTLEAVRDKWQPPMDLGSEQTVIIPIIFEITVK